MYPGTQIVQDVVLGTRLMTAQGKLSGVEANKRVQAALGDGSGSFS